MNIPVSSHTIKEPVELAENWRLYKIGPVGPENCLGHQFLLPAGWQPEELDEQAVLNANPLELTPVARFKPPGEDYPFFEVSVTRWPWEVDHRDFFELVAWQHGMKPLQIRQVNLNGLDVWDGMFDTVAQEPKRSARMMVFKSNDYIWRVWGVADYDAFRGMKVGELTVSLGDGLGIAAESLTLTNSDNDPIIGKLVEHRSPLGLSFQYPDCWTPIPMDVNRPGLDVVDMRLVDAQQQTAAYHRNKWMERDLHPREDARSLTDAALADWAKLGLKDASITADGKLDGRKYSGHWYAAAGVLNGARVVFWITVLSDAAGFCVASTMAPHKEDNRPAWMAAKRTHGLSVDSLAWGPTP